MALSVSVLHEHLSRAIGVEVFSPEGDLLLARTLIDIYSHAMLSTEDAAKVLAALPGIPPAPDRPEEHDHG